MEQIIGPICDPQSRCRYTFVRMKDANIEDYRNDKIIASFY
jgi:hypothetical protein